MNVVFAHSQNSVGVTAESGFDGGRLVGGHGLVAPFAVVLAGIHSPTSAPLAVPPAAAATHTHREVTA
ncbi:hypothetical protein [Subtercola endophyticus]|uniref:hypothetical protein n=1 Tax=Subtercola endophyticus TaxID=2895559 RepID=UPI001E31C493|nr:hypothetical protein [Subtercola endophyticus]UFS58273.1 hypothetical protein LQ955_14810 [Subtercola endophyticus]